MFIHENNLKTKIDSNYHSLSLELKEFYLDVYIGVKNKLINCNFSNKNEFIAAVFIIDNYLKELDTFIYTYGVTSQSKLRPTFLEELSIYLTKDFPLIKSGVLGIYNKKIFAGLKIMSNLSLGVTYKDVDFCIGKKVNILIDGSSLEIVIPIIAVEVKTYLDGTMLNEVMFSAGQIKNFTPETKIYVLMETNQVGLDKIKSAKKRIEVDEMFVLKNNQNDNLSFNVLFDYYNELLEALSEVEEEFVINLPGRLLKG